MNSHRPKSQNTSKERALIPEKETRRTWPRCHVSLEKSSKNIKPLEKWAKPNLSPDVTPRPANFYGEYFQRICHVVEPDPPELFTFFSPLRMAKIGERAGWSGVRYSSLTGWEQSAQFKLKMVSDVLLLSYLDKIGLSLTVKQGKLRRIYIVKRGYIREPDWRFFLSRLPHVLQATSPWGYRKSATATHVEQWVLCSFPLKISAALSLHFQHLMKTKG